MQFKLYDRLSDTTRPVIVIQVSFNNCNHWYIPNNVKPSETDNNFFINIKLWTPTSTNRTIDPAQEKSYKN